MALTNAERQARWRERQRSPADPADPDELTALADLLDSPAVAGALLERFGELRSALFATAGEIRDCLALLARPDLDRIQRKLDAMRTAARALQRAALRDVECAPTMDSWHKVLDYFLAHECREKETFHCLYLDRKNALLRHVRHEGTIDHCPVYPREVLREALDLGACALVLGHNHPSGNPEPSRADIAVTKDVMAACRTVGIAVHDHIVIGRDGA